MIIQMNENDILNAKIEMSVENSLLKHKARNIKAAKALIDFDKIKMGKDGLLGIEEQIKALKNSDETAFLFEENESQIKGTQKEAQIKGIKPETAKDRRKPKDISQMTYTEMCKFL